MYIFLHNVECSSPIGNDHVLLYKMYNLYIYADNIFIVTIIAYIYIAYELCAYLMKHAL